MRVLHFYIFAELVRVKGTLVFLLVRGIFITQASGWKLIVFATFLCLVAPCVSQGSICAKNQNAAYGDTISVEEYLSNTLQKAWNIRQQAPDSAILLLNTAAEIANAIGDSNALVTAYIRKGVVYKETGHLNDATLHFRKARTLAELLNDSMALGRVFINVGQNEKLQGNFDVAIENTLNAILIFEAHKHYTYVKVGYSTLASTHLELGHYNKSVEYYLKLLNLARFQQDSSGICTAWQNLGTVYFYSSQPDTALWYYQKSLSLAIALGEHAIETRVNNGIGSVYFEQGKKNLALAYFEKAEELSGNLGMPFEEVKAMNNQAAVYELRKDWNKAIKYYHKAEYLARQIGDKSAMKGLFLNLSETFEAKGQFDSALVYYQRYSSVKDSLINVESNEQIAEMQEKYESAKKDEEIAQLNRIEAEQRSSLQQRNFWLIGTSIVTVLLLIAFINYFSKLKAEKVLAKRTSELHRQKTMQLVNEHSEKSMKAYLEGETTERQRLGEQLHDQLGSQLATVKLYYDSIEKESVDSSQAIQLQKANFMLSKACRDVRHIAHNLAADTLTEFGLEAAVADLCQTITDSGQLQVHLLCVGVDSRLPATIELVVFRSIQELLTNAIKHADANWVQVRIKGEEKGLSVRVKDNGKGLSTQHSATTGGLGLQTISNRIDTLKGRFDVFSRPEGGVQIDFQIPIDSPENQNKYEEV